MTNNQSINDQRLIRTGGPRLTHTPSFDGFRGLGVLIVVFYHAELLTWLGGALIVIDWFFIASGFLITMIILDEREATGTNSLRRFYERRVLRLFPAMYAMITTFTVLMLVLTLTSAKVRDELGNWWIDALGAATYSYYLVAAIIPNKVTGAIGHTWSLSLEEQFYFIWPVLLIFVLNKARKSSDRALVTGLALFIVVMFTLRFSLHHVAIIGTEGQQVGAIGYTDKDNPTLAGIVYRIAGVRPDMIAYGAVLAFVYKALPNPLEEHWRRLLRVLGGIGGFAMFAYMALANRMTDFRVLDFKFVFNFIPCSRVAHRLIDFRDLDRGVFRDLDRGVFDLLGGPAYNIALLLTGIFILDLYVRPEGLLARGLSFGPLRWLGVRSYGIYLWHVLPILVFLPAIQNSWGVKRLILGLVAGSIGIAAGVASFRFIEKPFLHLKETKFRRPHDEAAS